MSAKPKVLVVTSTLPRWASDSEPRFILDLCAAVSTHYQVVILAPHCRGAASFELQGGVEIRRFRYFPLWGEVLAYEGGMLPKVRQRPWLWFLAPFFVIAQVVAVARLLRQQPIALIHAHWMIPQGLCVRLARFWTGRRPPWICTAHGADVLGLRGRLARMLQRWIARDCVRVGVVSGALADTLRQRCVPAQKIRLMPMGVTVPDMPPDASRRQPCLIAFAGRLVEKKGVAVLLEAFARLSVAYPDARLRVAGGGPGMPQLRQQAASLGIHQRVEFLGPVPHERVQALYAEATVAVMPSVTARDGDSEGLGLVMLEAMAAGCPVVVTDLPAVRDVIRPEVNGLIFPERDAAALAVCISRLLDDRILAARLASAGYHAIKDQFSWKAVAENHRRVYSEVLAAENSGLPGNGAG